MTPSVNYDGSTLQDCWKDFVHDLPLLKVKASVLSMTPLGEGSKVNKEGGGTAPRIKVGSEGSVPIQTSHSSARLFVGRCYIMQCISVMCSPNRTMKTSSSPRRTTAYLPSWVALVPKP